MQETVQLTFGRRGSRSVVGHAWEGDADDLRALCDAEMRGKRGPGFIAHDVFEPPMISGCHLCAAEMKKRGIAPPPAAPAEKPAPEAPAAGPMRVNAQDEGEEDDLVDITAVRAAVADRQAKGFAVVAVKAGPRAREVLAADVDVDPDVLTTWRGIPVRPHEDDGKVHLVLGVSSPAKAAKEIGRAIGKTVKAAAEIVQARDEGIAEGLGLEVAKTAPPAKEKARRPYTRKASPGESIEGRAWIVRSIILAPSEKEALTAMRAAENMTTSRVLDVKPATVHVKP